MLNKKIIKIILQISVRQTYKPKRFARKKICYSFLRPCIRPLKLIYIFLRKMINLISDIKFVNKLYCSFKITLIIFKLIVSFFQLIVSPLIN